MFADQKRQSDSTACLPIAVCNACLVLGIDFPRPGEDRWEKLLDNSACRTGTAIVGLLQKEIAQYGIKLSPIEPEKIYKTSPVILTVINPEKNGGGLHSTLAISSNDPQKVGLVNYKYQTGSLVEEFPIKEVLSLLMPQKGNINRKAWIVRSVR